MWFAVVGGIAYGLSEFDRTGVARDRFDIAAPCRLGCDGVGYVGVALAFMGVRIYLMHDVWQQVAASSTVHNLAAAENVAAQGGVASALGEGFADSLDVGGF